MKTPSRDPINNAINEGIRRDINVAIDNGCFRAAVILIFAGIDAMSHISRPASDKYNGPDDFKNWVKRYFHVSGQTTVTPEEWWAARNAIIHTYGGYARLHEQPGVRIIGWMVDSQPQVRYDDTIAPQLVLVDILAMRDAFFKGMENFLIEGFADPTRKQLMEKRINQLIIIF
jgi:hypothetical protein